jgi:hypothetical protein
MGRREVNPAKSRCRSAVIVAASMAVGVSLISMVWVIVRTALMMSLATVLGLI